MKKTSRRNFAKSVAGAIAAIPIVSVASGHEQSRQKRIAHENTPPPISIDDGSFELRIKHPNEVEPLTETSDGDRTWIYKGNLNGAKANTIEHIKVLDGSGEQLYTDLDAIGSVITIMLRDEDNNLVGTLEFSGTREKFEVSSTGYGNQPKGKGRLSYSRVNGKPARKHNWKHQGGDSTRDFRIAGIRVRGGSRPDYSLPPVPQAFESQEYRVLIWLAHH